VQDVLSVLREFVGSSKRLAIVCLGNELRGDDAVGRIVCEQLSSLCSEKLYIVYAGQDAARVIGLVLEGYNVLVVDALVYRGGRIGDIVVATVEELGEDNNPLLSTHTLPIHRFTDYLKHKILVVGVNVDPLNLDLGDEISREAKEASYTLANLLAHILGCRE